MAGPWAFRVGMVVPAWYPEEAPEELVRQLLARTLCGVESLCAAEDVVLVLDGQPRWASLLEEVARQRGFSFEALPRNEGKGAAVARGIERLLPHGCRYIVTRDSDGDHLLADMPALIELAELMAAESGTDLLIVSGCRLDRVRPLGVLRAALEEVTDRVLWQALQFYAAQEGRRLSEAYFAPYGDWPDIQSGYKVYSLPAAAKALSALRSCGPISRCGVETVPAVEILAAGGTIGMMARRTYQEQPISGYRGVDVVRMYGEPLAWAFRRLNIPSPVALALLDDSLLRCPLLFDAVHREALLAVRTALATALGLEPGRLQVPQRFF